MEMHEAQHCFRNLDEACITLASTSPSTPPEVISSSVYTAIRDVASLPRLSLAGTAASAMAIHSVEHLASIAEPLLAGTADDACLPIFQLVDWIDTCLGTTAAPHLTPLVCALLTAASPAQLHPILPSPALDFVEHLLLADTSPNPAWLLTCALCAMDTAFSVPTTVVPEALPALQCLQRLTGMGARIGGSPLHATTALLDTMQVACTSSRVPQRAAASCIALGALQADAQNPALSHMVRTPSMCVRTNCLQGSTTTNTYCHVSLLTRLSVDVSTYHQRCLQLSICKMYFKSACTSPGRAQSACSICRDYFNLLRPACCHARHGAHSHAPSRLVLGPGTGRW